MSRLRLDRIGDPSAVRPPAGRPIRGLRLAGALLAVAGLSLAAGACGSSGSHRTSSRATASTAPPTNAETSADNQFYLDLATIDPDLTTYVNQNSQVALKAMLADGIDLCDVLDRGGDIDDAMTSVAAGAAQVEYETGLPQSVKTFNAIDSSALLTLCPANRSRLPASAQANLNQLEQQIKQVNPTPLTGG